MSLPASSSAHTSPHRPAVVLTGALLLLQGPGDLRPEQSPTGGVLGTNGGPGSVLAAEARLSVLAGDVKGDDGLTCCRPCALRLVSGDPFAHRLKCRSGFGLAAELLAGRFLVSSSVPSSPPSMTPG